MTARNRTYHKYRSSTPENAAQRLTRALLTAGSAAVPHLHYRHHEKRWSKSYFHENRKGWLDLHSRYLRGE